MKRSQRRWTIALGAAMAAAVLWGSVQILWYKPRATKLQERLDTASENVRSYQGALDTRPRTMRDLRTLVDRTLGGDVETVDHRLRTRLNRIAEDVRLAGATVSTGRPSARQSPARLSLPREARELRDEIDFIELDGSITAEGSLEQVLALVDRIEAELWIKRINTLRLDPKNNGERFGVTMRLTTLFLPGRAPEEVPQREYDVQRMAKVASVVSSNPFRMPPSVVAAPPPPQAPPPQPRVEQWTVTGIAQGPFGTEVWLRNARSSESRSVALGQRVHTATFVAANGDEAEFELDQKRLVVAVGDVLTVPLR